MEMNLTIARNKKHEAIMDFATLREKGMDYIRALSSRLWSDHNLHDPGVTILEVLCYGLTDCGYRCNYEMRDLVTRLPDQLKKDFYTAREILTCNPTTILDLRKYIIDQEGVQNAWLFKHWYNNTTTQPYVVQPEFWYKCDGLTNAYQIKVEKYDGQGASFEREEFEPKYLNGLYNVMLQLEEDEEYGDLNSNVVEWLAHKAGALNSKKKIKIVFPIVKVKYPCWDYPLGDIINYDTITNAQVTNYTVVAGKITLDYTLSLKNSGTGAIIDIEWIGLKILIDSESNPSVNLTQADIENEFEDLVTATIPLLSHYLFGRFYKIISIIKDVYCSLHKVRNLCEDYVTFSIVPQQEIMLCADVQVELTADLEEVLAEIYYRVDRFLAPPVRFYNLLEMYEKGKRTEEIFVGPKLNHGFIIEEELAECELKTEIHTSDLYNIIMSIPGVIKIRHLQITNYLNGEPQTDGELWCLDLGGPYSLNLAKSSTQKIHFYKDELMFFADQYQVDMIIKTLKARDSKPKFITMEKDLPVPTGTYRHLSDYFSLQNDFPDVYKTGLNGITNFDNAVNRSHVKQLKAFLLFFDQILVNFFGQLDLAKDLLSVDRTIKVDHTYAANPVYDVTPSPLPDFYHVQNLIKGFTDTLPVATDLDDENSYRIQWEPYAADTDNSHMVKLRAMTENKELFYERRNKFLDHLIARFAESFGDYAYVIHKMFGNSTEEELIDDKLDFLYDYPKLSSERGKGFIYKCCGGTDEDKAILTNGWPLSNMSGLQRRVSRLLGITDPTDRLIVPADRDFKMVKIVGSTVKYEFRKNGEGPVLLTSKPPHFDQSAYYNILYHVIKLGADISNYVLSGGSSPSFELTDGANVFGVPALTFSSTVTRNAFIDDLVNYFRGDVMTKLVIPVDRDFSIVNITPTIKGFQFKKMGAGSVMLVNMFNFTPELYYDNVVKVMQLGIDRENYINSGLTFFLQDKNGVIYATPPSTFATTGEMEKYIQELITYFRGDPTDHQLLIFGDNVNPMKTGFNIIPTVGGFKFEFVVDGALMLDSPVPAYPTKEKCLDAVFKVLEKGIFKRYYVIDDPATTVLNDADDFKFYLQNKWGNIFATHIPPSPDRKAAESLIDVIIRAMKEVYYHEGMHIVEHILLRPVDDQTVTVKDIEEGFFPECKEEEDCVCPPEDHYSFRITIVLPFWPDRFRNMTFRNFAERVIRFETPAHILAKICWVDFRDMYEFEALYTEWLKLMCEDKPDRSDLSDAIIALVKKINTLTNVYPAGVLHDCSQPTDEPTMILGQASLGTFDDLPNA